MKTNPKKELLDALMTACHLSPEESKVYLTVLEHGEATPRDIARYTGFNRTSLYDMVKRLLDKGVLGKVIRGKNMRLLATDPAQLLEERRADMKRFEHVLPKFEELFTLAETPHTVKTYSGTNGLKLVLRTMLAEVKKGEEICIFGDGDAFSATLPGWTASYAKERIARGVRARLILRGTDDAVQSMGRSKRDSVRRQLMQIRVLPEAFGIVGGFEVFGDTAVFYTYGKEPHAVLIRDRTTSTLMRSVFEILWSYAEVYTARA